MEYNFLIENIIRFYKSGYAVPTFWIIFLAVYLLMLFASWNKNNKYDTKWSLHHSHSSPEFSFRESPHAYLPE